MKSMKMQRGISILLLVMLLVSVASLNVFASAVEEGSAVPDGEVQMTVSSGDADAPAADGSGAADQGPSDDGDSGTTRYLITGGIMLAIGIIFYVILSVKTSKKK